MTQTDVLTLINQEVWRAEGKHQQWPVDILHAVAILQEEAGELQRATLQYVYEDGNFEEVVKEAIQTGAMAVRFLKNLEKMMPLKSEQR